MTWAKLDDGFTFHPKVVMAGNEGAGIFARCLAYCGKYETDGKVPGQVAMSVAGTKKALDAVIGVGLLERLSNGDFYIRDYLDYNLTSDQIEANRRDRSERGKRGAAARWGNGNNHA